MGLSGEDVEAIGKSWEKMYANKDANGDEFLLQLFGKFPSEMNFFADFKGKAVEDLKDNPKVREVSGRIMDRLNEFVGAAGDADKLDELLQAFSKQHLTYGVKHQQYENVNAMWGAYSGSVGAGGADAAWGNFFGLLVEAFKKNEG